MDDWRARLTAWFRARLPSADSVTIGRLGRMPAGASNETIGLDLDIRCDGRAMTVPLVIRPERSSGILAPYDVQRQFRVLRALARTAVPVPTTAWFEADRTVLGAPFFCMSRVEAETLPLFWYGDSPRLQSAAGALALIHSVRWQEAGLEFLLDEDALTPARGELNAWRDRAGQFRIARAPLLVALGEYLMANEPADARFALLHGDPNPGNYLFRGQEVVAVVDWELAAIGDPRSDLGFYAALMTVFGGFPGAGGRTLLSDAYEGVTGRALHDLEYYEALGLYRMAVVMAAWAGQLGGGGRYGMEAISRRLAALLGPRWAA